MKDPTRSTQCLCSVNLAFISLFVAACGVINIGTEPIPGPVTAEDYPLYLGPALDLLAFEAPPGLNPRISDQGISDTGEESALQVFEGMFSGDVEFQLPDVAYEVYLERDLATAQQLMAHFTPDWFTAEYFEDGSWMGQNLGFRFHESRLFYASRTSDSYSAAFVFRSRNVVGILRLESKMDKSGGLQQEERRRMLFEALQVYLAPFARQLASAPTADPSTTVLPPFASP